MLPEYRLAPEHPHPAALEDARAVVTALAAEAGPRSIMLSGDSAGGGLAPDADRLAASATAAGVDVTYTGWPGLWHDFVLQPGLLAAADSAVAQAAWFAARVTTGG